jgi:hypothetical protein
MRSYASHAGRRSPDDFILTADGSAPPFGDLAKCATAAGANAGAVIQRANSVAWRWRARAHVGIHVVSLGQTKSNKPPLRHATANPFESAKLVSSGAGLSSMTIKSFGDPVARCW